MRTKIKNLIHNLTSPTEKEDLQTLTDYFDWVSLLNVRQIASGPISDVLTDENLKLTYGGRSAFLTHNQSPQTEL